MHNGSPLASLEVWRRMRCPAPRYVIYARPTAGRQATLHRGIVLGSRYIHFVYKHGARYIYLETRPCSTVEAIWTWTHGGVVPGRPGQPKSMLHLKFGQWESKGSFHEWLLVVEGLTLLIVPSHSCRATRSMRWSHVPGPASTYMPACLLRFLPGLGASIKYLTT